MIMYIITRWFKIWNLCWWGSGWGGERSRTDEGGGGGTVNGTAVENRHEPGNEFVGKWLVGRKYLLAKHAHQLQNRCEHVVIVTSHTSEEVWRHERTLQSSASWRWLSSIDWLGGGSLQNKNKRIDRTSYVRDDTVTRPTVLKRRNPREHRPVRSTFVRTSSL